ncbi:MAG: TolB family protein [Bacteroidales bacterium]|nr:TolB family protein [Bacteroidales bacterium]MCB8998668.1 TolB family protein [Bacteroidales bacterium]MCB9012464.1 TolB family protein [Bacteroidales bacterium]
MHSKKIYSLVLISFIVSKLFVMNAQVPSARLGLFDTFTNIGSPATPGTASYSEPSQVYTLSGSGSNIWFGNDSFSFLWKRMNGDFILQTRIAFAGEGHEPHRKAGIMLRTSTDPGSPTISCTVHGDGLTSLQYRTKQGEDMQEVKFSISGPDVLQLEKKGNSYIMSVAHFGEIYQSAKIENIDLGNDVLAGLFICSHNNDYVETATFKNTRIFNIAPDDLVQYKSYIGSVLEEMDIATGTRIALGSYEGSWQAPNWTPDGKSLIYNSEGKLYYFDLNTKTSKIINTDFADNNNNDHVLTFDGTQIGISHHPQETNGQSVVYTLPVTGGIPKRVTENSPSYLHGWSPDSKFLIYTAERNGDFDIYKISRDGGKEIRLTTAKGLDDGSEYSPDGKYIYFCSTRTGTMQVWRMDADGKNQIQLTFDEYNDWFPHVSPDNKWLVFVSFPKEVPADKHPFYERVYIRLMPIGGGEPRVIAYLYGGQGTMNVPSWSPDSKKIAFISNGIY